MDAAALRRAVSRHPVATVVTFVTTALVALLAAFLPQERFESTTLVSVQPASEGVSTQLLTYLIPSLEARVNGASLASDVRTTLPAANRDADWIVRTSVPPGSGVISITVNSNDRQVPAAAADSYAQLLANEDLGTSQVQILVIDAASTPQSTSSPSTVVLSGLALGLILAPLAALAKDGWGQRRREHPVAHIKSGRPLDVDEEPVRQAYEVR